MFLSPGFLRRVASFVYEVILLFAILLVAGLVYRTLFGDPQTLIQRNLFFAYSWILVGIYFVYCWVKTGQTLAMKTWRIKLIQGQGDRLTWKPAIIRYILASFSLFFMGLGFLWGFFDRENLFLHDRLTGCRLILTTKS